MIVDTTFIIDVIHGDSCAVARSKELEDKAVPLFTTTVSVFEIWQAIADINNKKKKEKIDHLLDALGLYSFDLPSAKRAGLLHAQLYSIGKSIQPEDSMIAGICLQNGKSLVTRNVKHFSRIKDLRIEEY
jgi:tRNA(fMet)-specific endonuclease VapC